MKKDQEEQLSGYRRYKNIVERLAKFELFGIIKMLEDINAEK